MTVSKITSPVTPLEEINKINEIIDAKYDASNPNGYTSNVGTVTSVNSVSPVNGNVTLSIPVVDQTYNATSANAQSGVAVASAISGKADDSTVVHKAGTETITGFKTLSSGAKITTTQSGAILELESAASGTNFLLKRTDGSTCVLESGGYVGLFGTMSNHPLQVRTNYINRMTFDTNGGVTLATAPSENSNDNQVATTAWTNSKIPTVNNATLTITQGGTTKGTFTANASSNVTIDLDSGGSSYTAGTGINITNNVISVDGVQTSELSIDTTPTQNSSNLITSGGVYSVLGDVETLINAL